VEAGDSISPFYDPMIAKLIVWGESREAALQQLDAALAQYQVVGVASNISFLRRIVQHHSFASGAVDTGLIARYQDALLPSPAPAGTIQLALLGLAECLASTAHYPVSGGWRLNGSAEYSQHFQQGDHRLTVKLRRQDTGFVADIAGTQLQLAGSLQGSLLRATINGVQQQATVVRHGHGRVLFLQGERTELQWLDPYAASSEEVHGATHLKAPMPGRVVTLLVSAGQDVCKGTPLLILEAMKMEHTIHAPADGKVKAFYFGAGEQVCDGDELVDFDAA